MLKTQNKLLAGCFFTPIKKGKAPLLKNWPSQPMGFDEAFNYHGACGVGVLTGEVSGGLLAIDIDDYSVYLSWLKKVGLGDSGLPETVEISSGNPGHSQKFFLVDSSHWPEISTCILEGLEFRWNNLQSVVYGPSPYGEYYNVTKINEPAYLPDRVIDWLKLQKTNVSGKKKTLDNNGRDNGRDNGHVDELEKIANVETAIHIMGRLRPRNDYNDWIRLSLSLKSADPNSEILFEAWKDWSKKADNTYSDDEKYRIKWNQLNPLRINLGTAIWQANQDDPQNANILNPSEIENFVFIVSEGDYVHEKKPKFRFSRADLNAAFPKKCIGKKKNADVYASASKLIKKKVIGSTWIPGAERIVYVERYGGLMINEHEPYFQGVKGSPDLWVKHVEYLFPQGAETIFNFLAFTLQRPDVKIQYALFLVSEFEGSGKDSLLIPMKRALGEEFKLEDATVFIDKQFNDCLLNTRLLVISEPTTAHESRYLLAENLKNIVASTSNGYRTINPKYGKKREIVDCNNTILLSNHLTSVRTTGSRRYFTAYDAKPPASSTYFDRLHAFFDNGGSDAVVYWLQNKDLNGFDPNRLPGSKQHDGLTQALVDLLPDDILAIRDLILEHEVIAKSTAIKLCKAFQMKRSSQNLKRALQDAGIVQGSNSDRAAVKLEGRSFREYWLALETTKNPRRKLEDYIKAHRALPGEDQADFELWKFD